MEEGKTYRHPCVDEKRAATKDVSDGIVRRVKEDATYRLEESVLSSQVASGDDSGSSNEGGSDVSDDVTVKVRGDDDVELLGLGDKLHGAG